MVHSICKIFCTLLGISSSSAAHNPAKRMKPATDTCMHEPHLVDGFLSCCMICSKCGAAGPEEFSESAAMTAWTKMWGKKTKKNSRQKKRMAKARRGW